MLKRSFEKKNFWIFDLDNTIYDPQSKIFDQIDLRMKKFISSRLNISEGRSIQNSEEILQRIWNHSFWVNEALSNTTK